MPRMKKKKSSRRGMKQQKASIASDEIATMISSLREHKKFAAMAKYSLNAVVKSIKKSVGGRAMNVRALVAAGAIEAVRDIIRAHPGNESILELATETLYLLTLDDQNGAQYITRVVETSALAVTLNSIKTNSDLKEGVVNTMALLSSCAERNATALSNDEHVGVSVLFYFHASYD